MSEEEIKSVVESGENKSWTLRLQSQLQKASETASLLSNKVKESETVRRLSTTVKSAAKVAYDRTGDAAKAVYDKTGVAAKVAYDRTGDAAKAVYDKTGVAAKVVIDKTSDAAEIVYNKTRPVAKVVYEKTSDTAKMISVKAGKGYDEAKRQTVVWAGKGRSELAKLREVAKQRYPQYFQSSGEESTTIQAFREALASGYEGVEVKAGQSFQLPFRVSDEDLGDKIFVWEFFLWKYDVNFKVVQRTMSVGGAVEMDVFNGGKVKTSEEPISGQYVPKEGGTIALVWDNTSSWMRSKHVAYRVRMISKEDLEREQEMKKKQAAEVAVSKQNETASASYASSAKEKRKSIHLEQAGSPVQLSNSLKEDDSTVPTIQLDLPPPGTVSSSSSKNKKSLRMPPKLTTDDGQLDSSTEEISKMKLTSSDDEKDDGSMAF